MCGIFGSINYEYEHTSVCSNLKHRGPDENGEFKLDNIHFSHLRLSILDLMEGKQPMQFLHYTIVFNGEVYNHEDVREQYGYKCKTRSDTETILHHFHNKGIEGLHDFDGMFAMCIYNENNKTLLLARDRAGKKPLYYYYDGRSFVFSSELNTLHRQIPLQIDEKSIDGLLQLGFYLPGTTPYQRVTELAPGGYLVLNTETLSLQLAQWWKIGEFYNKKSDDSLDKALEKVDFFLHKSVKDRIESSDLEVGVFLSGGIDSGLVAATASQYKNKIKTFTVSFDGSSYDEAPLARLVAEKYETVHHEISISFSNLKNDIEKILAGYGEPFGDDSAIPSYYVSKEAKKHVTVILNGDGADELFAGYRRYVPYSKFDFFNNNDLRSNIANKLKPLLPVSHNKKNLYNYFYRLVDIFSQKWPYSYFSATSDTFTNYEKHFIRDTNDIALDFSAKMGSIINSKLTSLQKILQLDFENILPSALLVKMDIATMLNSLEGRSPMLSKYLLEYAPTLPDSYKINKSTTKFLLRKLSQKYLPATLVSQPKRGFEIPLKAWINNELKEIVFDYVGSSNAYSQNFVRRSFIEELLKDDGRIPAEKRTKMLWSLFALEVWYRKSYKKM